jgi:hypothetical protein
MWALVTWIVHHRKMGEYQHGRGEVARAKMEAGQRRTPH